MYNCKYEVVNPHNIIPIQTRIPQIKPAYIVLNFLMKIAAIGIRVRKWIAYHGFAINIANDLSKYENVGYFGNTVCSKLKEYFFII